MSPTSEYATFFVRETSNNCTSSNCSSTTHMSSQHSNIAFELYTVSEHVLCFWLVFWWHALIFAYTCQNTLSELHYYDWLVIYKRWYLYAYVAAQKSNSHTELWLTRSEYSSASYQIIERRYCYASFLVSFFICFFFSEGNSKSSYRRRSNVTRGHMAWRGQRSIQIVHIAQRSNATRGHVVEKVRCQFK